jgi:hypothetical protein
VSNDHVGIFLHSPWHYRIQVMCWAWKPSFVIFLLVGSIFTLTSLFNYSQIPSLVNRGGLGFGDQFGLGFRHGILVLLSFFLLVAYTHLQVCSIIHRFFHW